MTKRRTNKIAGSRSGNPQALFNFLILLFLEIIVILLLVGGFCFWWYKWRPAKIISECSLQAAEKAVEKNESEGGPDGKFKASDRSQYYRWCLQENGIEK